MNTFDENVGILEFSMPISNVMHNPFLPLCMPHVIYEFVRNQSNILNKLHSIDFIFVPTILSTLMYSTAIQ